MPDRLEEIAVGNQAYALVPGVVVRGEVGVDVVVLRQVGADAAADRLADQIGEAAAELEEDLGDEHVLPAHDRVGEAIRQQASDELGDRVASRQRDHVARRALQHRHVLGPLGHRRDQGDRGRAAADHDDALARVVEVGGPVLGVDDLAGEALDALELGRVALVVAVVAGAAEQEVAGKQLAAAVIGALDLDRPAGLVARPARRRRPAAGSGSVHRRRTRGRSRGCSRGSAARRRSPSAASQGRKE